MTPTAAAPRLWTSTGRLADGREIVYFDEQPRSGRAHTPDHRPLQAHPATTELRRDPLLDEWVALASHRQNRTFLPPPDACPLCPTSAGNPSEIPAADYDVVVFENRFPSLAAPSGPTPDPTPPDPALTRHGGAGRCEVVCFTSDHTGSFSDLTPQRAATVIEAWAQRTTALAARPDIAHVYPFENRGEEIGVTLLHPHGQIYGYPFPPPRIQRIQRTAAAHRHRTGRNLFDDVLTAETTAARRLIVRTEHWTAFVPAAARWPFEVHLFPTRRVPTLPDLDAPQRADLAHTYLRLVRAFDNLFERPAPYIAAWNQAPVDTAGVPDPDFGLHLQLFTLRRAPDKLKHLAGSESGMGVWINDVTPEEAADRLSAACPRTAQEAPR